MYIYIYFLHAYLKIVMTIVINQNWFHDRDDNQK